MSQFTINSMNSDSESDLSDSTFDPDDYDSCYSDAETDSDEREADDIEYEDISDDCREELLEELLDLIRDAGYHYRIEQ